MDCQILEVKIQRACAMMPFLSVVLRQFKNAVDNDVGGGHRYFGLGSLEDQCRLALMSS